MAETRADNHEPAVYGYAAGSLEPESGLINVLELGMNGNTDNLMNLPFCFLLLVTFILHKLFPS